MLARRRHGCVLRTVIQCTNPIATASFSNLPPEIDPTSKTSAHKQAITSLLKRCTQFRDLKVIHATMIKNNSHQDSFLVNQFLTFSSTFCRIEYALLVFIQMDDPNVFVYNALLRAFIRASSPLQALQFYVQQMSPSRILPSSFTFSSLVKACLMASALELGEAIQGRIWKCGFGSHVFVQTGLIDFYANCGRIEESGRVFDEMGERDAVAWTTMISALAQFGNLTYAKRLFEEMPERNIVSWNTMIAGCARFGDVEGATSLFEQMPLKDLVSWTTMISCYSQNKRFREAIETFQGMKHAKVIPDEVTIATMISTCAHLGALDFGKEVHLYALHNGFYLDVYLGSTLIDMYAKCGNIEKSLVVFFKLHEKNLFCWNAMIEGLAVHGFTEDALSMFSWMERQKINPNGVTFVSVLSACTHAGLVEEGWRRFSSMIHDYSISPEIEHYGCMVDLLGRAGLLEDALNLIRNMKVKPNSVVWGALLGGCKIHGNLEIALIAANILTVLEPDNSGYYALLVNMHAQANQWGEVAGIRSEMKQKRVRKRSPGHSWIELEGKVHEFVATDMSHPLFNDMSFLLVELDGQLKLTCYKPGLVLEP